MSIEQNKTACRRIIDELWNKKVKPALVPELIAPNFVLHGPKDIQGPEGYQQWITTHQNVFPDFHVGIEKAVAEGDLVALSGTFGGTFKGGEYMGTKPTGKQNSTPYAALFRFKQGKAVDECRFSGYMTTLSQVNVPPIFSC